MNGQSNSGIDS